MRRSERVAGLRELAAELDRVDVDVYSAYGADPLEPIIGEGAEELRVGVFGRDPGRYEVEHRVPFIGAGGQKVRRGLYSAFHGAEMPDFAASLDIGRTVFWSNTVPYKPIGNKAWSVKVKKAFRPLMADVLVNGWRGRDVLCLGQVALMWFGLGDRAETARLKEHWGRKDRFETSIDSELVAPDGTRATFRLHPLPHPSPLNATWAPHFPRLLAGRLDQLAWGREAWRLV